MTSHPLAEACSLRLATEGGARRSRYAGWSAHRRLLSRAGGFYARVVLGSSVRDLTGGFKCSHADALRAIDLAAIAADGYTFQVEVTHCSARDGQRIVEIPIVFGARRAGRSKMSLAIAAEALWRIPALRLRTARRPSHATPAATATAS